MEKANRPAPSRPSAARASESLSERFGRYRILKRLGQGGMGAVYLAHDTQLDRQVALKVPHFGPDARPEVFERFAREARAAAGFDHPNLCPVYDVGEIDGIHYLTMPFIAGKALGAFIHPDKPLPPKTAAAVLRKVALALAEAHQEGVIHRDLKPSNILINQRKEPVVMDFGLARRDTEAARLTQSGQILGTPAYMSPEQVGGGPAVGPASDVYSLGVILFEMLTGRLPFEGPVVTILTQILMAEPPLPSQLRPGLDPVIEAICRKAMAKKVEDRYGSMAELAAALTDYLKGAGPALPLGTLTGPEAAPPPAPPQEAKPADVFASQPGPAPQKPRQRSRRWPVLAAAAAGLLLLGGVVLYYATDHGTVKIELNDPAADVQIKVDGQVITFASPDETITVRAGDHDLEVTGKNFATFARKYAARRGTTTTWSVELKPKADQKAAARTPGAVPPAPAVAARPSPKASSALAELIRQGRVKAPGLDKQKLLYADDFNDWRSNWALLLRSAAHSEGYMNSDGSSAWPAPVASKPGKGRYFIRRTQPGWLATTPGTPAPERHDRRGPWSGSAGACQVDGRILGDAESFWGIDLSKPRLRKAGPGQRADPRPGVGVYLNGRGRLRLRLHNEQAGRIAEPHGDDIAHPAIKPGDGFNKLLVILRGRRIEVYVNGVAVCEPSTVDFDFCPAQLFLYMATASKGEAEYERVRVYATEGLPTMEEQAEKLQP